MLKVLKDEKFTEPCALLLGGFDGLHKGHETLLAAAKKTGLPVGITSIAGLKAGGDIFTLSEREVLFERAGISFARELVFDEKLKNLSAKDFLSRIFEKINAKAIFCGEDFRFGRGAEGDVSLLKRASPCPVHALPVLCSGGEKIASSQIKAHLSRGEVAKANELMQGNYFVRGIVEHGRGVGHTLGFPTVNVAFPAGKYPLREGVYGGRVGAQGASYPAIVNFGARPTFGVEEKRVEAYLSGFSGDLYGEEILIYPEEFLRPVVKFKRKEELIAQLERDKKSLKEEKI